MAYGIFTQGTILEGVRSVRFPNIRCYGIVITARCDLTQNKASNIFYLIAMDVETWVRTEGILYCSGQKLKKGFDKILNDFGDKIPDLSKYKNASHTDIERAIRETQKLRQTPDINSDTIKVVDRLIKELDGIRKFIFKPRDGIDPPKELLQASYGQLDNVFDDKLSQYHFVPRLAYASQAEISDPKNLESLYYNGLIINLSDVNFWEKDLVKKIEEEKLDYDRLMDEDRSLEIETYNKSFFLNNYEDKMYPEQEIRSPYIERLMQVYTSLFARIGVDFDKEIAKRHWKRDENRSVPDSENNGGPR